MMKTFVRTKTSFLTLLWQNKAGKCEFENFHLIAGLKSELLILFGDYYPKLPFPKKMEIYIFLQY